MNFDFIGLGFCRNDYLSPLPEIPIDSKVQMLEHIVQGGGPAATASVAAARLGLKTAFISVVGDDDPGKKLLADFEAEKVSTCGMVVRKDRISPIAYCWIDAPIGKRSVAWTRGNLEELQPEEVNMELIRDAKVLHLKTAKNKRTKESNGFLHGIRFMKQTPYLRLNIIV